MLVLINTLIGYFVGVLINLLADYLPARRHYFIAKSSPFSTVKPTLPKFLPHREDGALYPLPIYSGVIAALRQANVFDAPRRTRRSIVEVGLALGYGLVTLAYMDNEFFGGWHIPFLLFYGAALTLITVIDMEHRFVMIETILVPAVVALIEMWIYPRFSIQAGLQAGWYAFLIMFGLWLFGFVFGFVMHMVTGKRISRTILGFGDVEIATLGGLILGWQALGPALLIMAFTGGIGALVFIANRLRRRGRYRAFSAIPYGPYICLGVAVALFIPSAAANMLLFALGFNPFA